jgi:NTE family protein
MFKQSYIHNFLIVLVCCTSLLVSCAVPPPNIFIPEQQPPPVRQLHPRVALVLGGGGARGMAHVGVLRVLQQEHIPIDLIVGTSAGSIVGALYADSTSSYRTEQALMEASLFGDILDLSLSLQGPASGNALQNFILRHSRARYFNQLRIPFIAVATDLNTGRTVPISSGPVAPAVNASAALPPIFRPVPLYGHLLVDGGVTDLIPVNVAKKYNPKITIAVSVIPDLGPYVPGTIVSVYDRAYDISDRRTAQFEMKGADVQLHPYVGQTGVFQSSNKLALVRAGEAAARRALPQICALLRENNIRSKCS